MWLRPMIRDLLDLLAGQAADPRGFVREARDDLLRLVARAADASADPAQREQHFALIADELDRAIAERFGGATRAA
jgi:hypothetical protein